MSAINDAQIEAVARSICEAEGGCLCLHKEMPCEDRMIQACAAIRALTPLIIERCAEAADPGCDAPCGCAGCECGKTDDAEAQSAWREGARIAAAIRALIPKEADHA